MTCPVAQNLPPSRFSGAFPLVGQFQKQSHQIFVCLYSYSTPWTSLFNVGWTGLGLSCQLLVNLPLGNVSTLAAFPILAPVTSVLWAGI